MSIKESARSLLLAYVAQNSDMHIEEAKNTAMPHEEFLDELLAGEVEHRRANRLKKRVTAARFPYKKHLADFDAGCFDAKTAKQIQSFRALNFIKEKANIILIGNPGVGKTHLAIAIGMEACVRDLRVLYANVPTLVTDMHEAMSRNQLGAYRRKFEKYDLVIVDELGYVSFGKKENELLFNLLCNRNGAGSVIVTTNLVFDRWDEVFQDTVMTGALVDRLAHKSYVVDMSGESYRVRETKEWMENKVDLF